VLGVAQQPGKTIEQSVVASLSGRHLKRAVVGRQVPSGGLAQIAPLAEGNLKPICTSAKTPKSRAP
jgi:hypothetical protein